MKWVLAGLSFAFLVAVAVGTVALKAANVRTTRRIEMTSMNVEIFHLEVRKRSLRDPETREQLARRWRGAQSRMPVDSR